MQIMIETGGASNGGVSQRTTSSADQLQRRDPKDVEAQEKVVDDAVPPAPATEVDQLANVGYVDILKEFSLMGWVAFGGPAAHIALFQKVHNCD